LSIGGNETEGLCEIVHGASDALAAQRLCGKSSIGNHPLEKSGINDILGRTVRTGQIFSQLLLLRNLVWSSLVP
jgi:hypothetical protein